MLLALAAIVVGLIILVWSADRFVGGASAVAGHAGISPLVIGMVIVGFGTSAPELVVSAIASMQGNPGLALGNAYGSNITNIALIIGLVALLKPVQVASQVLRKELPILLAVSLLAGFQMLDGRLTRLDAVVLLLVFAVLMGWSIWHGRAAHPDAADPLGTEMSELLATQPMPMKRALFWLILGLVLLIASSRLLVGGAVTIAQTLGVSDLIIGLTIVAVGTSLPELASSLVAMRKGEHDIALGNVIGSNLFNTLAVVGLAVSIRPLAVEPALLYRDWTVMFLLTVAIVVMGYRWGGRVARINRIHGALLLAIFIGYSGYLVIYALRG